MWSTSADHDIENVDAEIFQASIKGIRLFEEYQWGFEQDRAAISNHDGQDKFQK